MDAEYFRTLFDHLYWARDKVIAAAEGLSDDEYAAPNGFTYKSIRGILTHCMSAEVIWMARLLGEPRVVIREDDVPSVAALKARWLESEGKVRAWLAKTTDAEVAGDVKFLDREGNERSMPRWHILTLLYHHTVQHRSEAAEALTMVGRSPGDMDFMIYTAARAAAASH